MPKRIAVSADLSGLRRRVLIDLVAKNSDKSLVVPEGEIWQVMAVRAELTTSVDAGSRRMCVEFVQAGGGVMATTVSGLDQAASTTIGYTFAPGMPDLTQARAGEMSTPLPSLSLGAGDSVRVFDANGVAKTADDLTVRATVLRVRES